MPNLMIAVAIAGDSSQAARELAGGAAVDEAHAPSAGAAEAARWLPQSAEIWHEEASTHRAGVAKLSGVACDTPTEEQ